VVCQIASTILTVDLLLGSPLVRLPSNISPYIWGGLVLPTVYVLASTVSSFLFKDALVLKVGVPLG
jgi:hypothetical protein